MDFLLPADLELMHQSVRLRILSLLQRQRDVGFGAARAALGLTAGNLASHLARLADAGFVEQRQAFSKDGLEMRIRMTPEGQRQFSRYLQVLKGFLERQVRNDADDGKE